MKDDQRIALTKRMLKEGLLRLLKIKDLNKISVTELCSESGINRATFYRHYEQPRDILNELRRNIFQDIKALEERENLEGGLKDWLEDACNYFYENSELLNILFRCRTDEEFVVLINDMYKEHFPELRRKGYVSELDDDSLKLGAYYFAGGIYYILRQWLSEPINKTPKEVASLIHNFLNIS